MKKSLIVMAVLIVATINSMQAQYHLGVGKAQLNAGVGFSSWGVPVYLGIDVGVHKDISVGGEVSFRSYSSNYWDGKFNQNYSHSIIGFYVNGNYHFNSLLNIPKEWDFYAGANVGFFIRSSSDPSYPLSGLGVGLQVGGRYYFNKNWGINLEFGGGNAFGGGKIGATYAF